jgi:hypothetical protein
LKRFRGVKRRLKALPLHSKKKALPLHSPPRRFVRFRELSGRRRREDDSQARPQAWDARPQAPVLRCHRGNRAPCLLGFAPPSSSHSTEPRAAPLPPRGRTELLPPVLGPSLVAPGQLACWPFCSFGAGGASIVLIALGGGTVLEQNWPVAKDVIA